MRSIGHNKKMRAIHWFRNDLRLGDNPALNAASEEDVLPIFILDTDQTENLGEASKVWLHHSLDKLNQSLGGKLHFIQGDAINEIMKLIDSEKIDVIYWNKVFEPNQALKDSDLIKALKIDYQIFNGSLLWEPQSVLKDDGTPYKVYTPYSRKWLKRFSEKSLSHYPSEAHLDQLATVVQPQLSLNDLGFEPSHVPQPQYTFNPTIS